MDSYLFKLLSACGIALLVSLIIGPVIIPFLTRLKVGQNIREEGPQRHYAKAGTPTMGGIIIITAVITASFILAGRSIETWSAVLIMIAFGGIGFWDDYIKVVLKRSLGLRARDKLGLQLLMGILFWACLVFYLDRGSIITVPFSGATFELGYLYLPFIIIVLMSSANGVNLTDGLDGLAAGVTLFVSIAFAVVSIVTKHYELGIFCAALAGACIGFLVFNHHPARVFMGDTGSMALGGAVAAVAAITGSEIALVIIGGVYVLETLSVIIQVVSFQATGKRVFLMAPLHHHFELKGWNESQVVRLFWLLSLIFVIIGLLGIKPL